MNLGIDGREFQSVGRTGIGRYLGDFIAWTVENRPDIAITVFLNQRCVYTPPSPRVPVVIIHEGVTQIWDQLKLPSALKRHGIEVFLSPYLMQNVFLFVNLSPEASGIVVAKNTAAIAIPGESDEINPFKKSSPAVNPGKWPACQPIKNVSIPCPTMLPQTPPQALFLSCSGGKL